MDAIAAEHSLKVVFAATLILIILAIICLRIKNWTPNLLITLYILIVTTVILATGYLAFSTIFLNVGSFSGGPVHWHADFEIWACGKEVELEKPHGLSNKIGEETLHSHGDNKIHQEGVVVKREDASLGNFFRAVGGNLSQNSLSVPTEAGILQYTNGMNCPGGRIGQVEVFVYQASGRNYRQQKLTAGANYIISPQSQVPPGDCIIVEFDSPKSRTDKLCLSYKVAKQVGKLGEETP